MTRAQLKALYADDYQFIDGIESVTIEEREDGTQHTAVAGLPTDETLDGLQADSGFIGPSDDIQLYFVWEATLATYVPAIGDIVDRGSEGRWTVEKVAPAKWGSQFLLALKACKV